MATRAAFWIGDPRNIENREWVGCVAYDGDPDSFESLAYVDSETKFREFVNGLHERDDFSDPNKGGWPFPWNSDVFLTDFTYTFFDGEVKATAFYHGFIPFQKLLELNTTASDDEIDAYTDHEEYTLHNVPSCCEYDKSQPDSIIIF